MLVYSQICIPGIILKESEMTVHKLYAQYFSPSLVTTQNNRHALLSTAFCVHGIFEFFKLRARAEAIYVNNCWHKLA